MNLKSSIITLMITSALFASATHAEVQANLSANQAFSKLSPLAVDKIRASQIDANALMNNSANDLIINFDENAFVKNTDKSTTSVATRAYKAVKDSVLNKLSNTTMLRDYYGSPVSFVRVESRADLVALLNNPYVKSVSANRIMEANLTESLSSIGQPEAQATKFRANGRTAKFDGEGSVVAVLDTGLNPYHKDFGDCSRGLNTAKCKVAEVLEVSTENNGRTDGKYDDGSFHGSNVSAIVGGVAPKAKLVSLDVFSWSYNRNKRKWVHTTPFSDVNAALNWVKNNHIINNPNGYNFVATNLSLGSSVQNNRKTYDLPIISSLKKIGVATVIAAGNDGYTRGVSWPASENDAITVGATIDKDYPNRDLYCNRNSQFGLTKDQVTCFSNSGRLLDLLAPGYDITAGGRNMSGTSQATPHVAGAIAVMRAPAVLELTKNRATNQTESVDDTLGRLVNNGVNITDYRNAITRPRIDLLATVKDAVGANIDIPDVVKPEKPVVVKPKKPRIYDNPYYNYYRNLISRR